MAVGVSLWVHGVLYANGSPLSHLSYISIDVLLALPFAGAAIAVSDMVSRRLGTALVVRAAGMALAFTVLLVPLAMIQAISHAIVGGGSGSPGHRHATELGAIAAYGLDYHRQQYLPDDLRGRDSLPEQLLPHSFSNWRYID
jgi:hypothetical protein